MNHSHVLNALPRFIAHRGESGEAPENTLSALELAASNGATWAEIDVNTSADGIAFVHHDDSLDRCTNGSGYLITADSKELDQLDAGSWYSKEYAGEKLARLDDVHALLVKHKLGLNLEIKPTSGWELPTTDIVCDFVAKKWSSDVPLLISSFSDKALLRARERLPDVAMGMLVCAIPPDWQEEMQRLQCQSLHCDANFLTEKLALEIKTAGYSLLCFTVNDQQKADQLHDWGVDSVFTDYPSRLTTG